MRENPQIANVDLVKQMNSAVVYKLIDQQGPISRIQISEISQLAPASVTKITRHLLARGLIKEVEQQESTGGRRATSIVAEYKNFRSILVGLGREHLTLAIMDLSAKLLKKEVFMLPNHQAPQEFELFLFRHLDKFMLNNQTRGSEFIAIGITVPGFVDMKSGMIEQIPHFVLSEPWDLANHIAERFHLATYIGHDVRSLALAEHYFGVTKDCYDSLLLRIHRGVGAGIVINHEVFLGYKNNVGEIGHIQVDPLGKRCMCGNVGCLETVVSNSAIENKMSELLEDGYQSKWLSLEAHDIEAICKASNKQDAVATELIEHVGVQIGWVLAMSVNMFNPEKIVISGEITQAKNVLFAAIRRTLESHALPAFVQNTPLVTSELSNEDVIGAFALIKRALFDGSLLRRLIEE
ncbi:ROK family transcriptional regulator [Aggregatibacter actinomycetemcomitans]|uniref:ROK family transcriptional regulator n=1 Tax=Aggregatibacter actinomycetemcomitans TaxID=714 RepID=UPI00077E983C|nr:ROK family transcriptional regulator [Aggregatibacter actinomycetemcomitans]KYK72643.1 transcriptional regulator [Aggregatibacter actinomycetemcomitans serotype e str. SA3096]KYK96606.1 transcriptional regulator [Aggregatibacter actinomycetemcomitans serotype e str. ANH9776]TYB22251.1 ROK family protein [Aggregatibacter actinomycetemcomitans]